MGAQLRTTGKEEKGWACLVRVGGAGVRGGHGDDDCRRCRGGTVTGRGRRAEPKAWGVVTAAEREPWLASGESGLLGVAGTPAVRAVGEGGREECTHRHAEGWAKLPSPCLHKERGRGRAKSFLEGSRMGGVSRLGRGNIFLGN